MSRRRRVHDVAESDAATSPARRRASRARPNRCAVRESTSRWKHAFAFSPSAERCGRRARQPRSPRAPPLQSSVFFFAPRKAPRFPRKAPQNRAAASLRVCRARGNQARLAPSWTLRAAPAPALAAFWASRAGGDLACLASRGRPARRAARRGQGHTTRSRSRQRRCRLRARRSFARGGTRTRRARRRRTSCSWLGRAARWCGGGGLGRWEEDRVRSAVAGSARAVVLAEGNQASCATGGANTHRLDMISSRELCSAWWASMPTDARVRRRARGVDRLARLARSGVRDAVPRSRKRNPPRRTAFEG